MEDPVAKTLKQIERYCERHKMKESRFGRNAANNTELVKRIRAGNVKVETLRAAQRYMNGETK